MKGYSLQDTEIYSSILFYMANIRNIPAKVLTTLSKLLLVLVMLLLLLQILLLEHMNYFVSTENSVRNIDKGSSRVINM